MKSTVVDESKCEENPPGSKRWTVGTLTYTTGGLAVLFCWLLWGDFAWSMRERSVPSVIQLLFKKYDASDMVTGLLIGSLPAALAMLIGPIISYKSDRHRSRWGRRIPFLLIPTPIAVLAMVGLAFSPQLGEWLHELPALKGWGLNVSILLSLGLFWTLFEFASIIANSVFGGLVNDVVPQPVLGRFFGLFRALSLIAGIIFNFWMLGKAETHFVEIFIGIGLLYGVGFTVMCLKVKEGTYPPPPDEPLPGSAGGFFSAAKVYFRDCFGHSYYLWFFGVMSLCAIAGSPVNLFSVFYARSVNMSMGDYGTCLALTYLISLVLAYPLGALADRFHPLRVSLVAMGLYVLTSLWGGLYADNARNFGIIFVVHGVLMGTYFTASASLAQKLLPRQRFAELNSACGILISVTSIVVPPSIGLLLDQSGHVYRYTFYAGAGISVVALACGGVLYRKFMALGGPSSYRPPE